MTGVQKQSYLDIPNIKATSTTILGNLNSLSSQSFFLTNYTNLNNLNVSGISKLNGAITCNSTLNIVGNIIGSGTALTNLNYNAITNPPNLSLYLPLTGGTITGQIIQTGTNSAFFFGGGGGAAFGQAGTTGAFSFSALTGDCVIRSQTSNNLILQSGTSSGGIIITPINNTIITGATTCNSTLNISNVLTLGSNSALYLNNASNSLLAVSQTVNQFSNSAITGDTVLRANSTNSLIFQTGAGTSAISINPSNNIIMFNASTHSSTLFVSGTSIFQNAVSCNSTFYVTNSYGIAHGGPNISQSTIDSNNFGNSCYYNAFAGDSHLYSFWGVSINLNNGGSNPSGNAGNARIANTASFTINQKSVGGGAGSAFTNLFTVLQGGNVGIGTTTPSTSLFVSGTTTLNNATTCNSTLNVSSTITNGSSSYIYAGGLRLGGFDNSSSGGNTVWNGNNHMSLTVNSGYNVNIGLNGGIGVIIQCNNSGTTIYNAATCASTLNVNSNLKVYNGVANITNTSPYAVANNYMQAGSLTIGDTLLNYGNGTSWTSNTAGLLMECLDNTEIAVHDAGNRVASLMQYMGNSTNTIIMGRDMGWGTTNVSIAGNLTGASNVSKRAFFAFTPTQSLILPYNWYYTINLSGLINAIGGGSNMYIFRITIWTSSGDFNDTGDNVQTMQYNVFLSDYAGGKSRLYQTFNSTSGASLNYVSSTQIMYVSSSGYGGGSAQNIVL